MPDPIAPTASAPAAPAATPSAPATPSALESTPAPPAESPAVPAEGQPSTPESDSGAGGAPATIGREPSQADFPGDIEGYLNAHYAWERGEEVALPDAEKPADATTPADDVAKPENEDEDIVPLTEEPTGFETPQALQEMIDATPGLKDVLAANPQIQGKLSAMARENTKLRPLGEIFPSVEAAQYANETANTFVGLRSSIMSAGTPEEMGGAFEQFADQFKIVDAEGKPVMDAQGKPTYGEDFDLFMNTTVSGALTTRADELKAKIASLAEGSPEHEEASLRLNALDFVMEQLGDKADDAIVREDLSQYPENIRKQIEAREAEVARKEEELGIKRAAGKKADAKRDRAASEVRFNESIGKSIGSQIETFLDAQRKSGAYVPSFAVEYMTDDGSGGKIPLFGKNVVEEYGKYINSIPMVKAKLAEMQLLPPTPENERARTEYASNLLSQYMPAILKRELGKIQQKEVEDREKRRADKQNGRKDARVEPQGGNAAPLETGAMTDEQAYAQAKNQVERDFPNISPEKKMEKTFELRNKLLRQGQR